MKCLIKDIVLFIVGVIAEMIIYFLMPYLEMKNGDYAAYILLPILVIPIIGLIMGLFIERKIKLLFPIITVVFSILFMEIFYKQIIVGYILIYMLCTLIGVGIGWGIRTLVLSIAESFRTRKDKLQTDNTNN